jgi:hypothetical protein
MRAIRNEAVRLEGSRHLADSRLLCSPASFGHEMLRRSQPLKSLEECTEPLAVIFRRRPYMSINPTVANLVTVADEHLSLSAAELEVLLDHAWTQTGLIDQVPVRGSRSDFWQSVRDDLMERAAAVREDVRKKAAANRDTVSVITGMMAADVLEWANTQGIPAEQYEYPLGLLVAWVTLAILKRE